MTEVLVSSNRAATARTAAPPRTPVPVPARTLVLVFLRVPLAVRAVFVALGRLRRLGPGCI
jgi:hypothetical protein